MKSGEKECGRLSVNREASVKAVSGGGTVLIFRG